MVPAESASGTPRLCLKWLWPGDVSTPCSPSVPFAGLMGRQDRALAALARTELERLYSDSLQETLGDS